MNKDFGTHLPVVSKILSVSKGPVLELGSGYASTMFLYWSCLAQGRGFLSLENNREWVGKMDGMSVYCEDWSKIDTKRHWGMVLVDNRPASARGQTAIAVANSADFVILHDSDSELVGEYGYDKVYPHYKYRYDFTKIKPNTVVLSNFINLDFLKNEL